MVSTFVIFDVSLFTFQLSGKFSASNVRVADHPAKHQRPERLRMRNSTDAITRPQVSVIRLPRGPSECQQVLDIS